MRATLATPALAGDARECGIASTGHSDTFSSTGRAWVQETLCRLPPETGRCVDQEIEAVDGLQLQIARLEARIQHRCALATSVQLLKSLSGLGDTAQRGHLH